MDEEQNPYTMKKNYTYCTKTFLFLTFLMQANGAFAQSFAWAKALGGIGHDLVYELALDQQENPIAVGYFVGNINLDPSSATGIVTAQGQHDIFIQKRDSSGNVLWFRTIGGTHDDIATTVTTDATGNIYVSGFFTLTVDFDPGPGIANLTSTNYAGSAFILKLDPNGNFVWAKSFEGQSGSSSKGHSIQSHNNDIFLSGRYAGTVDFDLGPLVDHHSGNGNFDSFILKIDTNGNYSWAKTFGSTGQDYSHSLTLDNNGNVYSTGRFVYTVDFDPGVGVQNRTSNGGNYDVFILKLDNQGNFQWVKTVGSTGADEGLSIVSGSNAIYLTGYYTDSCDFDPGTGVSILSTTATEEMFVLKLNHAGNFDWAKTTTTTGTTTNTLGLCIALSGTSVYAAGNFTSTTDFDPGAAVLNVNSQGSRDICIWNLDRSSGNLVDIVAIGGTDAEWAGTIATGLQGSIYFGGMFRATVDFDPGPGIYNIVGPALNDGYVAKLYGSAPSSSCTTTLQSSLVGNTITGTASASGGTAPYTYSYSLNGGPPNTSGVFSNLGSGVHVICATALDAMQNVCFSDCDTFTISPLPINCVINAGFTQTSNALLANFSNTTTISFGTISAYNWDFGDGNFSTLVNPTHTYAAAGNYNVCLIANGLDSLQQACIDTLCAPVQVQGATSLNDISSNSLKLYPNPTSGNINIDLPLIEEAKSLKIYDVSGRSILELSAIDQRKSIEIELGQYSEGIYFLRLQTDKQIYTSSFRKE